VDSEGPSSKDILDFVVDEYRAGRINPSRIDYILIETNIRFALMGKRTEYFVLVTPRHQFEN